MGPRINIEFQSLGTGMWARQVVFPQGGLLPSMVKFNWLDGGDGSRAFKRNFSVQHQFIWARGNG